MSQDLKNRLEKINQLFSQFSWLEKNKLGVSKIDQSAFLTCLNLLIISDPEQVVRAAKTVLHDLPGLPETFEHQGVLFLSASALRGKIETDQGQKLSPETSSWLTQKINFDPDPLSKDQEKILNDFSSALAPFVDMARKAGSLVQDLANNFAKTNDPKQLGIFLAEFFTQQNNLVNDENQPIFDHHFFVPFDVNPPEKVFSTLMMRASGDLFLKQKFKVEVAKSFAEQPTINRSNIKDFVDAISTLIRPTSDQKDGPFVYPKDTFDSSAFVAVRQMSQAIAKENVSYADFDQIFESATKLLKAVGYTKNDNTPDAFLSDTDSLLNSPNGKILLEIIEECGRNFNQDHTKRATLILNYAPFLVKTLTSSSLIRVSEFTASVQKIIADEDKKKTDPNIEERYPSKIEAMVEKVAQAAIAQADENNFASVETYQAIIDLVDRINSRVKTRVRSEEKMKIYDRLIEIKSIKEKNDELGNQKQPEISVINPQIVKEKRVSSDEDQIKSGPSL